MGSLDRFLCKPASKAHSRGTVVNHIPYFRPLLDSWQRHRVQLIARGNTMLMKDMSKASARKIKRLKKNIRKFEAIRDHSYDPDSGSMPAAVNAQKQICVLQAEIEAVESMERVARMPGSIADYRMQLMINVRKASAYCQETGSMTAYERLIRIESELMEAYFKDTGSTKTMEELKSELDKVYSELSPLLKKGLTV